MSLEPFVAVARVGDVKPGQPLTVVVDGREIALFNVDGAFYAIDNACPHQGAPLADGWLEGATITCTWHAWCFRLADGHMTGGHRGVDAFDVRVDGEHLCVSRTPRPESRATR